MYRPEHGAGVLLLRRRDVLAGELNREAFALVGDEAGLLGLLAKDVGGVSVGSLGGGGARGQQYSGGRHQGAAAQQEARAAALQ